MEAMEVTRATRVAAAGAPLLAHEDSKAPANDNDLSATDIAATNSEMLCENKEDHDKNESERQVGAAVRPSITQDQLRDNDVLCDDSGQVKLAYSENQKFQTLIHANSAPTGYLTQASVKRLINTVRAGHGRFLKSVNGTWQEMEEEEVARSIKQAFSKRFEALEALKVESKIPIVAITDNDVLSFPRSAQQKKLKSHPGNQRFEHLIKENRERYFFGDRQKIVKNIVGIIRANNGRFLKKDTSSGPWYEMTEIGVKSKTSQALSDAYKLQTRMFSGRVKQQVHEALCKARQQGQARKSQIQTTGGISANDITNEDVLCMQVGGQNCEYHPGSQRFRQLVKENRRRYFEVSPRDKQKIIDEVISAIRAKNWPLSQE